MLRRRVNWCVLFTILLWSGAIAVSGQNSAPPPNAQTFSSRAELVLVPAVVTDKSGEHRTGLPKDSFTVLENGVPQKIAVFDEIRVTSVPTPADDAVTPKLAEFSNITPGNSAPRRVNIVLIDQLNSAFWMHAYTTDELAKFAKSAVDSADLTMIMVLRRGKLEVVQDFTSDPQQLTRALAKLPVAHSPGDTQDVTHEPGGPYGIYTDNNTFTSTPPAKRRGPATEDIAEKTRALRDVETAAMNICDSDPQSFRATIENWRVPPTLQAFHNLARAYSGVPGRKSLLWVTFGFPFCKLEGQISSGLFANDYERIFNELNDANIAVYPIDARGLVATTPLPSYWKGNVEREVSASLDLLKIFAESTGGRAYLNRNDIAVGAARAAADSTQYYVLGYYRSPHPNEKPGWRRLDVKVTPLGSSVRARAGYYVTPALAPDAVIKMEMTSAQNSPFDFTALPLVVRWTSVRGAADGDKRVDFEVQVQPGTMSVDPEQQNRASVQVLALVRDPQQHTVTQVNDRVDGHLTPTAVQTLQAGGFTYSNHLDLAKGQYNVRFVVRDNLSGRIGSVLAPLTVD